MIYPYFSELLRLLNKFHVKINSNFSLTKPTINIYVFNINAFEFRLEYKRKSFDCENVNFTSKFLKIYIPRVNIRL